MLNLFTGKLKILLEVSELCFLIKKKKRVVYGIYIVFSFLSFFFFLQFTSDHP